MNPKNYREWSADVNLISHQLSTNIAYFSHPGDMTLGPAGDLFRPLFHGRSICLTANDFSRKSQRSFGAGIHYSQTTILASEI
jgi:hypothetical protein